MRTITIGQMKQVLKHCVFDLREPSLFLGLFGVGKTAGIEQYSQENDIFLCKVLLGQYKTVDLKGTPWVKSFPNDENDDQPFEATVWHPAMTLPFVGNPNFPTDKPILLFLDEITSAETAVLGVCYQLINELCVGEHKLMPNVYIAAAGNRESDKGIVNRFPMPLNTRLTQYDVGLDLDGWCQYMQAKYGKLSAMFVAYFRWQKGDLCTWDPAKPEKVVAVPRTVEKAMRYYNADMPEDIKMAAMAGAIGEGLCAKIWGFVKIWVQITALMEDIKANPKTAEIPKETSAQWAVAVSISGELNVKNCTKYFEYLKRMEPEYVISAWQMAIARDRALFGTDEFIWIAKQYKAVFGR